MTNRLVKTATSAGSLFFVDASRMDSLCAGCAHLFYGCEACPGPFRQRSLSLDVRFID